MGDVRENFRVVYVAGYGRSGSTLVDAILGNHPDVFGSGELRSLFMRYPEEGVNCSCGIPLGECSFWHEVMDRIFSAIPDLDCSQAATVTRNNESMTGDRQNRKKYVALWSETFRAISAVSGNSVIVDSSKSDRVTRYRLQHFADEPDFGLKVIHLVRDPRAVMYSALRGNNRRIESGAQSKSAKARDFGGMLRVLLSWKMANGYVEDLNGKKQTLSIDRFRYEDLARSPEETFATLGDFLEIDLTEILSRIREEKEFDTGHGITGNRMRRKGPIKIKYDDEWQQKLPWRGRLYSQLVRGEMARYGYA